MHEKQYLNSKGPIRNDISQGVILADTGGGVDWPNADRLIIQHISPVD